MVITDITPGVVIHYTLDNNEPTINSPVYTVPISINTKTIINAIAFASDNIPSLSISSLYQFYTAQPTINPAGGAYATAQPVTLSDSMPGAQIYYTLNSTTPNTTSTPYSGPITISSNTTLKAVALVRGYLVSTVATTTFTIQTATPSFSVPAGHYSAPQSLAISDTTPGAVIYYTTNGDTPTQSSTRYTSAITVSASETIKAIAIASGYAASPVAATTYTITILPQAATPTFSIPSGKYTSTQAVTFSDATAGAVIHCTINGAPPTAASAVYGAPISVATSESMNAIAVASGYSSSDVATADYIISSTTPGAGEWTWAGGSNNGHQGGVYGTLGSPAAGNIPGGRFLSTTWTDSSGDLWLFGGTDLDQIYNDLWQFNPSTGQWAWKAGSSTVVNPFGTYGTLGTPAPGNTPGGRQGSVGWSDIGGHFWLFGGAGFANSLYIAELNDLWEFDPSSGEWTWEGGSSDSSSQLVYGTLGTPAPATIPGGRDGALAWIDSSGNFWIFGGNAIDLGGSEAQSMIFGNSLRQPTNGRGLAEAVLVAMQGPLEPWAFLRRGTFLEVAITRRPGSTPAAVSGSTEAGMKILPTPLCISTICGSSIHPPNNGRGGAGAASLTNPPSKALWKFPPWETLLEVAEPFQAGRIAAATSGFLAVGAASPTRTAMNISAIFGNSISQQSFGGGWAEAETITRMAFTEYWERRTPQISPEVAAALQAGQTAPADSGSLEARDLMEPTVPRTSSTIFGDISHSRREP